MKKTNPCSLFLLAVMAFGFALQTTTAQNYNLYGITRNGGKYGFGAIFRYTYPSGKDTVVLNFNDTNGADLKGYLKLANDNCIYSQASEGGTYNMGVLYRFNPSTNKDTVLINFSGANGESPKGGIMQASNGLLYGFTFDGGAYGKGVCYSYDPVAKIQTILFNFDDTNGANPDGHMIQASNGLLYGHTPFGGTYNLGVLFCYNITTNKDSVVVNFDGTNGTRANGLMQATNGLIYGYTMYGGFYNYGVMFSYDPVLGNYKVLFDFNGPNGISPNGDAGALLQTSSDLLYGAVEGGGTNGNGLLFTYNLNTGYDSILVNFGTTGLYGKNPWGNGYCQIPGGMMFFPVDSGGLYGVGTLASYNPITGHFTKLLDFNDTNGAYPITNLLCIENELVGINTIKNDMVTNLFPNPNAGTFTLSLNLSGLSVESRPILDIYNVLGQKVFSENLNYIQANNNIDLGKQPAGIYFYRVSATNGSEVSNGKFIIE